MESQQEVSEQEGTAINAADNSVASNTIDNLIEAKTKELEALIAAQSALVTVNNDTIQDEPMSPEPMPTEPMSTEPMPTDDTSAGLEPDVAYDSAGLEPDVAYDSAGLESDPASRGFDASAPSFDASAPASPGFGASATAPVGESAFVKPDSVKEGGKTRRVKFFDMFGLKPVRTRRRRRTVKKTRRRRSRKGSRRR